jgi:SAM domain (Sterile alpha motif)
VGPASKTSVQHEPPPPHPFLYPPPPFYGYGWPAGPAGPLPANSNSISRTKTPSLLQFLKDLEKDLDKAEGTFTQFEDAFTSEEIDVQYIKDLDDQEMIQLGITKIGWRKALRDASSLYK